MKGIVVSSDGNQATQYKVLKDSIPVFCAKKGYNGVGGIVHDIDDWKESTFFPSAPSDAERRTFSQPYITELCVETVTTVAQRMVPDLDADGNEITDFNGNVQQVEEDYNVYTQQSILGEKWVVTDESLQKIVIGKYKQIVRELEKK